TTIHILELSPHRSRHGTFIKNNQNLKRLEGVKIDQAYSDTISNLNHLEHLRLLVNEDDENCVQQTLQPISPNLKVLHLEAEVSSLRGLVFPDLRDLVVFTLNSEVNMDVLDACPNLESVEGRGRCSKLLALLKRGEGRNIKKLHHCEIDPPFKAKKHLGRMLKSRAGFKEIDLNVKEGTCHLSWAINHQESTLTYLTLEQTNLEMHTMVQILRRCGQLQDVSFGFIERGMMLKVARTIHWRSPMRLKMLQLSRYVPNYHEDLSTRLDHTNTRIKLPDDQEFFSALFLAAQGFTQLRTINIDCMEYTKALH
ncbi:hypothetical protein BGX31_002253, partial [Mortierella sp. GBA43]